MGELQAQEYKTFEAIKHTDEDGMEFWYARELMRVLEYRNWQNFNRAIERAMIACNASKIPVQDHFTEVSKSIITGKNTSKNVLDYKLSRYACYLIVQNGDPRKKVIALGQTYFAIQTRRQEVADYFNQLDEDSKRLIVRGDVRHWNLMLAAAAHKAGLVSDEEYAVFQNAGYKGLYGGMTVVDIHKRKGLNKADKILDYMGSEELAANLFRITQTESKLNREKVQGAEAANATHFFVGSEVRQAIKNIGGTMPEELEVPEESISEIERRQLAELKEHPRCLMLDE